jgi:radical SAM superfamily enzyme YgiQ (UPF0313 family)
MKAIIFTGYERSGGLERVGGAYRIATVLRKEGWDIEVVDFFYHWTLDQLKELIKIRHQAGQLSWVGFSATWINYSSDPVQKILIDLLRHIKENYPEIITLAGGQNPSIDFPIYDDIDYIIGGFGEHAVLTVLKYKFSNGTFPKGVPRKNGWYIDANAFYPAWPMSDLSIDYEPRDFIYPNETLSTEISRGCKFACTFCNFPVLGVKEDTTRDLDGFYTELQRNYDLYGVSNYQVADETLNDRDEKLVKMGNIAKRLSFEPNFSAFIRGDILFSRPQQKELLADAGVWSHYFGIETFNHDTGKSIGKGMHPDKIKAGLLDTRDYFLSSIKKYRGTVSLVYGLPKETKESIALALDWLCTNWSDQNVIAFPFNINLTGKKSTIDEDYEKYGYKIMKQEKRELYNRHNFFSNDLTIWENENMNMYDAIEAVDEQIRRFRPGYLDSWKLFSMLSVSESIEFALGLHEQENGWEVQNNLTMRAREIKSEYINKKLGL